MTPAEAALVRRRLRNQRLPRSEFRTPEDVVTWLGAVQSQDYPGAKWGLGLRAPTLTDAAVDEAFNAGRILRTHVMRPTWHFVMPADIRWLLALTRPRVHATIASYYRKFELTSATFARSEKVMARALQGGGHLTRVELRAILAKSGLPTENLPFSFLLLHAELEAVICSGPRRGKHFTYALLDERAPLPKNARTLSREEALAELTQRYFTSHGPATVRDYVWWSGLIVREARAGVEMVASSLVREVVGDLEYWSAAPRAAAPRAASKPTAWLLPNYDEFLIAFKDRGLSVDGSITSKPDPASIFEHLLIIDGVLVGSWKRTEKNGAVSVQIRPFRPFTSAETRAVSDAAARLGTFMNLPVSLSQVQPR